MSRWRDEEPEPDFPEEQPRSFDWGLTPGGAAAADPPAGPVVDPAPTQAWTPPPLIEPPAAIEPPAPPSDPVAADVPTQAMAWSAPGLDAALPGAAELFAPEPLGTDTPLGESLPPSEFEESSGLDELFGEQSFLSWDDQPASAGVLVRQPVEFGAPPPRAPISRTQRTLMWVAGSLAAALAMLALFVLGTRLGPLGPPDAQPTIPVDPGPPLPATGPLPAGTWGWQELRGGECLQPFDSAWQDEYTVVDCAAPHAAQLLARIDLAETPTAEYPGFEALEARVTELCTAPAVIDYAVATGIGDLVAAASFAADSAEWNDGNRQLLCFAQRSSGEPLTASLAVVPVPESTEPAPES